VVAKTKFSMCTEEVDAALDKLPGVRKVLVVGIETHVCVMQTSLDLLGALGRAGGVWGCMPLAGPAALLSFNCLTVPPPWP
jgi:nicotinamidase-related amidase